MEGTVDSSSHAGSSPESLAHLPTPPGSAGLPLLGETLDFLRGPGEFVSERFAKYGDVFSTNILGKPTLFLYGADANHWIYAGEGKYLENEWSPAIQQLLGKTCLSLLTGEAHKRRRLLLAPHFKRTSIDGSLPAMLMVARKHLQRWQTDAELGPIAIVPRMRALAFEIAATYLLGELGDLGVDLDDFSRDFETWTNGMFVALAKPLPYSRFGRAMAARRRLFTAIDDLVMRRDAGSRRGPDVLSTLLEVRDEDGELLPRDTIVDELQLLLFAGHDTTVTATSNAIYHLALHPEIAAKARDEQAALPDQNLTLEAVRSMTYLEAIIKESMRLIPPIGGAFRVMLRDEAYRGFRIPKGWRVAIGPRPVHGAAEYFPEPERFDPTRWLDPEQNQARPPFAYIPFGGGPRTCLGMHFALLEMHVVLAKLLRGFEWTLVPDQDLSFKQLPLPLPRSGTIVELRRRPG